MHRLQLDPEIKSRFDPDLLEEPELPRDPDLRLRRPPLQPAPDLDVKPDAGETAKLFEHYADIGEDEENDDDKLFPVVPKGSTTNLDTPGDRRRVEREEDDKREAKRRGEKAPDPIGKLLRRNKKKRKKR